MKNWNTRIVLGSWLLLMASQSAHAAPAPGVYLRGFVGYATQALGDVNDDIQAGRSDLGPFTSRLDWEDMGGAAQFGGEVGYQFSPMVSAGFGIGYQKSSREHAATVDFTDIPSGLSIVGAIDEEPEVSVVDFFGTLILWVPTAPGLHFGGQLGMARGKYEIVNTTDLAANDGSFIRSTLEGDADQTIVSAGIFAGYEHPLSPLVAVSARAGYRFCNFADMEGEASYQELTDQGPFSESGSGKLTDSNGNPMDVDLSGLQLNIGVTLRLGAAR